MLQSEIDIINSIFPETKYIININKNKYAIYNKSIHNKYIDSECIEFTIHHDHIYIDSLHKCGDITGTILLENTFKLAQQLPNIQFIQLIDKSEIYICNNIRIILKIIKILTIGKSWYNQLGYESDNYKEEELFNGHIIKQKYNDFRKQLLLAKTSLEKKNETNSINKDIIRKKIKQFQLEKTLLEEEIKQLLLAETSLEEEIKQLINEDNKLFLLELIITNLNKLEDDNITLVKDNILFPVKDDNVTVQEYFSSIWKQIRYDKIENCKDKTFIKKCKWLSNFLIIIFHLDILKYNNKLIKFIKPKIIDIIPESTIAIQNKYLKYKNKYLNLKNKLGKI